MDTVEHTSFFRTHKVLAFLPLLLMGAGVWYYIQGRVPHDQKAPAAAAGAEAGPAPRAPAGKPPANVLPDSYDPQAGLDIQGSEEFRSQVTHALKLVWMADRETFLFVRRSLAVIRNENKTGFYREDGRPVAALSSEQAFRSLTWCAGVIAHQAWHSAYDAGLRRKQRKAPPLPGEPDNSLPEANPAKIDYTDINSALAVEAKAFAFQLEVLRKIGAPRSETGQLAGRAPRDFSPAHDGSYSLNP